MGRFLLVGVGVMVGVAVWVGAAPNGDMAAINFMQPTSSRIFFDNETLHRLPPENLRTMAPPRCTQGATDSGEPCVDDEEYNAHVSDYVKNLLTQDNMINTLVTDEELKLLLSDASPRFTPRINNLPQESPVCAAQETLIHPKRAKNPSGEWLFVVNQDEVRQAIRVEKCIREGSSCNMGMKLPSGATTICRQKYVYRRLLTVGSNRLQPEEVLMPSCCVCYSNQAEFDIASRFRNTTLGGSGNNPAPPQPAPPAPSASPIPHPQPHPQPQPNFPASPVSFPNAVNTRQPITYQLEPVRAHHSSIFRLNG